MVRKLKLIFLLSLTLLSILGTTSFANVNMTEEIADNILDYFATNLDAYNRTSTSDSDFKEAKNSFANADRLKFSQYFNENFHTKLNFDGNYSWNNIAVLGYWDDVEEYAELMFIVSNNTAGGDIIDYLFLDVLYNNQVKFTGWNGVEINGSNIKYVNFSIRLSTSFSVTSSNFTYGTTMYQKTNLSVEGEELYYKSLLALSPAQVVYYRPYQGTVSSKFLSNYYDADPSEPEIPDNPGSGDSGESGDTGGGTGGDTGGGTTTPDYSEDLDNIQTGITDINNNIGETNNKLDNISGELSNINNNLTTVPDISDTTITNDDITSNLDFDFEQDPYTNFWLDLTTGLGNAFTNNKREINIQFRDKIHIISLDNFSVQIPSALKPFLTIISTVFITWKMLQYIKIIIDNISSGNIDEVLEMNEEEGITNLF